ncbi:hypothetical protein [Burkholderia cepacia]|uniref:hypothetical protein n=1 Tax=Burkholderia cepacia TaxID=292 RepID=UPI00075CD1F8|nr:hypothetical protein [Burkholderia cepacia]KWD74674.1 hypothetical protein WL69_28890 [Burkholderia cepacia]
MREEKMSFSQRCICECLRESPGIVLRDLAARFRSTPDGMKRTVGRLVSGGYVKRGRRSRKGNPLYLTGKQFPPSCDVMPAGKRRHIAIEDGFDALIPAMRAMVDVGRASA